MSGEPENSSIEVNDADANELRLFVAETLAAVMQAVGDVKGVASTRSPKGTGTYEFKAPDNVEFDIAMTVRRTAQAGGRLKLQVFSVGANAGGETASELATVSRVKFSIPRVFLRDE